LLFLAITFCLRPSNHKSGSIDEKQRAESQQRRSSDYRAISATRTAHSMRRTGAFGGSPCRFAHGKNRFGHGLDRPLQAAPGDARASEGQRGVWLDQQT